LHAPAYIEQPRIGAVGFQFSSNVDWMELPITQPPVAFESSALLASPVEALGSASHPAGVRALYARLAEAYEAEPVVKDRRGGAPGDPYPL
jgi:hypothetical protein